MSITDEQVTLLNKLPSYTPALHDWFIKGSTALGDIIKAQQTAINSIPGATTPLDISQDSPSNIEFTVVPANNVFTVSIKVNEAFGSGAAVTIGTSINPTAVGGAAMSDLTIIGTYILTPVLIFNASTELFINLDTNSSVTGQAKILLIIG